MRRIKARITPYIQSRCVRFRSLPSEGVQYLEANLDILRLEETLKQGVSRDEEKLVDGLGPVVVVAAVGDQWFDEVPPHEIVAEQATLGEMSNEQRRTYEAAPSTTLNRVLQVSGWVLGCSYRKPSENVKAEFVNKGYHEIWTAGCIAELLQEPRNIRGGSTFPPRHGRHPFHKIVDCRELFVLDSSAKTQLSIHDTLMLTVLKCR
jgi:hypothetical protein